MCVHCNKCSNTAVWLLVLKQFSAKSLSSYNAAVAALEDSERPVARIRAIRVYRDRIKMALQNVCAIPIYGKYGITLSSSTEFINASPPNTVMAALPAPKKYNSHVNLKTSDDPTGSFVGVVGPINPGSYIELVFVAYSGASDIRHLNIGIEAEANGYFGSKLMLGCKKDVYSALVSPDLSIEPSCNSSEEGVRYKVEVNEAP